MPSRPRQPRTQTQLFPDKNRLYYGDNLRILRVTDQFPPETIDLVYLDPPFKPNEKFNVLFRDRGPSGVPSASQVRAFEDTWQWGPAAQDALTDVKENAPHRVRVCIESLHEILHFSNMFAYMVMMAPRLVELHRVMKPTASIFLHCDYAAARYLGVLMDSVFGAENLRNEIEWKRTTSHSSAKKYAPVHDRILYYAKSARFTWNSPRTAYDPAYLDQYYRFDDGDGRLYWRADLCAEGVRRGLSGQPWRGFDPAAKGMHWKFTVDGLDELDAEGRIYWPSGGTGWPQYKRYRDELKGKAVPDWWDDIARLNPRAREREGYPTQKPEALLERVIRGSSNPGEVVLDPFCGCGTTVAAAESLGRRWVGIDVTYDAIPIIRNRLARNGVVEGTDYEVWGSPETPEDAAKLAEEDKYQFQWWAVRRLGARETELKRKKGPDRGVDGRLTLVSDAKDRFLEAIVSVKGGGTGPKDVRELAGTIEAQKADLGVLVTVKPPTRDMRSAAYDAGEFMGVPRLQILTAAQIIAGEGVQAPTKRAVAKRTRVAATTRTTPRKRAAPVRADRRQV